MCNTIGGKNLTRNFFFVSSHNSPTLFIFSFFRLGQGCSVNVKTPFSEIGFVLKCKNWRETHLFSRKEAIPSSPILLLAILFIFYIDEVLWVLAISFWLVLWLLNHLNHNHKAANVLKFSRVLKLMQQRQQVQNDYQLNEDS